MNGLFKRVGAVSPGRSVFDLSYEKSSLRIWDIFIPLCVMRSCQATFFRDWKRGGYKVPASRFPMMHEVNCYVHYFFVPYRLLDDNWEDFITGGVDGDDVTALARWEPVSTAVGSLWDYFGFPTGVTPVGVCLWLSSESL